MTLLDQHLDLQAQHRASVSTTNTSQAQLSQCQSQLFATETQLNQLHETHAKYDHLAALVSAEDPLLKELYDRCGYYPSSRLDILASDLCKLRPYLWPDQSNKADT